jgi:hypothetical protein
MQNFFTLGIHVYNLDTLSEEKEILTELYFERIVKISERLSIGFNYFREVYVLNTDGDKYEEVKKYDLENTA